MERMILCFIEDDFGARHAREIGTDRICMETDYPHSDAVWPNAPERMMEAFAPTDLTDDEINQITHLNAMKFFQYDPFTIRPREKCTAGALRAEAVGHDVSIVAKGRRVEHDEPMTLAGFGADCVQLDRPRPAQPGVLGRRRRRLPGRARRRRSRSAPLAWGAFRVPGVGAAGARRRARPRRARARVRRRAVVDRARRRRRPRRRPRRLARCSCTHARGVGRDAAARAGERRAAAVRRRARSTSCSAITARSASAIPT